MTDFDKIRRAQIEAAEAAVIAGIPKALTDDTIALPPLPDRITETGARRIFLTEQEAMDYAREAVRLYIASLTAEAGKTQQALRSALGEIADLKARQPVVQICAWCGVVAGHDEYCEHKPGAAAPTTPPDAALDAARYVP